MVAIGCRLARFPQCGLRLIPIPAVLLAGQVAVENGLVLVFVAAEAPSKMALGPNDLAADRETSLLQRTLKVPLPTGSMTNIQRRAWLQNRAIAVECSCQELPELLLA